MPLNCVPNRMPPLDASSAVIDAYPCFCYSISLEGKASPALTLGPADVLKLTFQVVENDEGKGVQPHQTFLRFYDEVSGEEGIQPVRVTAGGKAKFELVHNL